MKTAHAATYIVTESDEMPTPRTNVGPCFVDGCDTAAKTAGMCKRHYEIDRRNRTDSQKPCVVEDCTNAMKGGGKGMCPKHYRRFQRFGAVDDSVITFVPGGKAPQPCAAETCDRLEDLRWTPYCSMHGARMRRHGSTDTVIRPNALNRDARVPDESCDAGIPADKYRHHQRVWKAANGPTPEGMQIDHRCRIKSCTNLDHMELVTAEENRRRRDVAIHFENDNGVQTAEFWLSWNWDY